MALPTRDDIYRDLTPIFRRVFDDATLTPNDEMTAGDVARWDSLNHINMIVAVEQKFGVKFRTVEVNRFPNVGALVSSIIEKKSRQATPA